MSVAELEALRNDPLVKIYNDTVNGDKFITYYRVTSPENDRYDVGSYLVREYKVVDDAEFQQWSEDYHATTLRLIRERGDFIKELVSAL